MIFGITEEIVFLYDSSLEVGRIYFHSHSLLKTR